jgi:hypothetical protein
LLRGAISPLQPRRRCRLFWRTDLRQIEDNVVNCGIRHLFASGEDLAGIMDALRWKSPRMPLAYNRNLAAEHGAAGWLMRKLG